MSVQVEKLEHNMAKLTVEVPAEEFEKSVEKAYQKNKSKINVPGFRKGKVPRKLIEKMYGPEFFYRDAVDIALPEAYEKAFDSCGEEIVSSPEIDIEKLAVGEPFVFTATVALNPVAVVKNYKGVEIEKVDVTVTDEDVEERIKSELDEQARMVSVEREVKSGDEVILDYEGSVDGVPFAGGKGENHPLTIGSNSFIPGFEDQIIGHKIDEDFDVNVTFPDEYHAEELAGKAAVFKCRLHEIKEKQVPELDEDFADDQGFDSVEDYRKDIRAQLEMKKQKEAREQKEDKLLEKIVEEAELDVPEAMIKSAAERSVNDFAQQLAMQGMNMDMYFKYTGLDKEKLLEQNRPYVETRIRRRACMEAVAKAENLSVSDEEYDEQLKKMAETYQMELDKVRELVPENEAKEIRKDILIQKAIDFVIDNAVEK